MCLFTNVFVYICMWYACECERVCLYFLLVFKVCCMFWCVYVCGMSVFVCFFVYLYAYAYFVRMRVCMFLYMGVYLYVGVVCIMCTCVSRVFVYKLVNEYVVCARVYEWVCECASVWVCVRVCACMCIIMCMRFACDYVNKILLGYKKSYNQLVNVRAIKLIQFYSVFKIIQPTFWWANSHQSIVTD